MLCGCCLQTANYAHRYRRASLRQWYPSKKKHAKGKEEEEEEQEVQVEEKEDEEEEEEE